MTECFDSGGYQIIIAGGSEFISGDANVKHFASLATRMKQSSQFWGADVTK